MEGIVRSKVPGLEDEAAIEGTARAVAIGAANYWHSRAELAEKRNQELLDSNNVARLAWFVVGALVSAAVGGVLFLVAQ